MLIRFIAKNFLSFDEETEFNMLTSEVRRLPHHVHKLPKVDLLKSAVIYGANGAGKSNLIMAIEVLQEMISGASVEFVNVDSYFRLGNNKSKPTTLEIEFSTKRNSYNYGITFFQNEIQEEWLYLMNFGLKEDDLIFERKINKRGQESLNLSAKYLKTEKDLLRVQIYEEELLESHVPFLSIAKESGFKDIAIARDWIIGSLLIIYPGTQFDGLVKSFLTDIKLKDFINNNICNFETGINEIDVQTIDFEQYFGLDNKLDSDRILKRLLTEDVINIGNNALAMIENKKPVIKKPVAFHKNKVGERIQFELNEESDGTLRLIDFIPAIFILNNHPITILIDEVDQSLHPHLLKQFLTKVQETPNRKGQLILTTHESNLLDLDIFRQDEIWFAEKNEFGASHFYPLSDFDVRTDLDIRKGYLSGRFGAIPFLGDLDKLSWKNDEVKKN